MKARTLFTSAALSALLIAAPAQAHTPASVQHNDYNSNADLISASDALKRAAKISAGSYDSVVLIAGPDDKAYYVIEGIDGNEDVFIVLNAETGADVTEDFKTSSTTLAEAIAVVDAGFEGEVIEATLDFEPNYDAMYHIIVDTGEDYLLVMLDSDTLKVIETEILTEEEMEMEMSEMDHAIADH